jgi:hypothetical protein
MQFEHKVLPQLHKKQPYHNIFRIRNEIDEANHKLSS